MTQLLRQKTGAFSLAKEQAQAGFLFSLEAPDFSNRRARRRRQTKEKRAPRANASAGGGPAKRAVAAKAGEAPFVYRRSAAGAFFSDEGSDFEEEEVEEYNELPPRGDGEDDDLEETVGRAEYDKLFDKLEDENDEDEDEEEEGEEKEGENEEY